MSTGFKIFLSILGLLVVGLFIAVKVTDSLEKSKQQISRHTWLNDPCVKSCQNINWNEEVFKDRKVMYPMLDDMCSESCGAYHYYYDEESRSGGAIYQTQETSNDINYFNGYECTDDCSGHEAGHEWAEDEGIEDEDDCGGNSWSFIEGCESYVEENY